MAGILLSRFLAARCAVKFEYGSSDCASFVISWLDLVLEKNAMADWLWRYHDQSSCEAYIAAQGGFLALAQNFIAKHYGLKKSQPARGNILLVQIKNMDVMAIRLDEQKIVVLKQHHGLYFTEDFKIVCEWGLM
jgi:hypothetical protein